MLDYFFQYISKYPTTVFESACILIPLFIGIFKWHRLTQEFRLIWGYTIIIAIIDIPLWYTALRNINNYALINLQEILIAGWLFYVIYRMLDVLSLKSLGILYAVFLAVIFFDFNWLTYSGKIFSFNRIIFIGLSFMFFYELLEKLEVKNLLQYPRFWFFTGLLISSLGTLFMFVFTEYTSYSSKHFLLFSYLKDLFKYILVTSLSIALFLDNRNFKLTIS